MTSTGPGRRKTIMRFEAATDGNRARGGGGLRTSGRCDTHLFYCDCRKTQLLQTLSLITSRHCLEHPHPYYLSNCGHNRRNCISAVSPVFRFLFFLLLLSLARLHIQMRRSICYRSSGYSTFVCCLLLKSLAETI